MPPYYTAPLIITNEGAPLTNGFIETDDNGTVISCGNDYHPLEAIQLEGVIIPGFINTHCHLELSHLKGKISPGRGMAGFINDLLSERFKTTEEEKQNAMQAANLAMIKEGIVAVGDISNSNDSLLVKSASNTCYHTFLELLGLQPAAANSIMAKGRELCAHFNAAGLAASLTLHAPYSVSEELLNAVINGNMNDDLLSIHLLESVDEIEFCSYKTGPLADLYKKLAIDYTSFKTYSESSTVKIAGLLPADKLLIAVHNTFIEKDEMYDVIKKHPSVTWCLCPNANLFITGMLPPLSLFNNDDCNVAIGTDSLASNNSLSVLNELKTLSQNTVIPFERLIKWATINGAKALKMEDNLGSIKPGKNPGLIHLTNINSENLQLQIDTTCERLI